MEYVQTVFPPLDEFVNMNIFEYIPLHVLVYDCLEE